MPSTWSAFSKLSLWLVPFLSFKPQLKCQLLNDIFSEHPHYLPPWPPACFFPGAYNLQLLHLPVYSLVYCLSPSTPVQIPRRPVCLFITRSSACSLGSGKDKCLFNEQTSGTTGRYCTCLINKAKTIIPNQQRKEIVSLLLR